MFCQNLIKILCLFLLVHSSIFGSAELDAQYRFSAINRRARYTPYRNMTRFPVYKDRDQDGVLNFSDNCPNIPNEDQLDSDNDDFGNVCDNCPYVSNKGQQDSDGDGIGDACEQAFSTPAPTPTPTPTPSVEPASPQISDSDGDGIADSDDNCPNIPNSDQSDHDGNGLGDACDFDSDGDGISDSEDNCPRVKNPGQADHDGDGLGDKCDSDAPQIQDQDEDDYADDIDNCPEIYNPWQMDDDQDGIGNECDDCPGATVDECGVCGGDGKSCADPCASYRFQVGINPVGRGLNPYRGGRRGLSNVLVLHQKSAPDQYTTPQCWYDINAKAENYLDRVLIQYDFTNMEGHPLAFLQTRSAAIARMIQNTGQATTATPILSPNTKLTLPVHFNPESYIIHTDKNCNVIENPTEWEKNEACDAAVYYRGRSSCPVSLLWEEGTDIEHGVVVRNFKLDLEAEGEWTEWKASGAAPLLVDLSKGTKITSATQLIGNWTFGGMPHASLQSQQTRGTKWRDGFAVLEYLDADQSGELSGTELKNLGLWFDFNRNAVSDEGEVKTLAEAMVSRLFYQGSREDTNGNITLEIGYERVNEQGATLKGASIDWYGTVGPNKSAVEVFTSAQTSK